MSGHKPSNGAVPGGAFSPATVMLRSLRQRQISAVELLELHLRRIERVQVGGFRPLPGFDASPERAA
jgi:hypothetical protein